MHSALLIPEVRSNVLNYLVADTGTGDQSRISTTPNCIQRAGQRALATLARTCRTLSEPALDVLWFELRTLKPLLQCSRDKGLDFKLGYDRSLTLFNEREWNIVLRYAPRVRRLTITDEYDDPSIDILQSLWFRTTLLLPNLRKLHWNCDESADFPLIRLLLGPSLRHLDVRLAEDEHDDRNSILGFLEWYHTLCPNLESLRFRPAFEDRDSASSVAAISRAVCRSPTLEALTCHALSEEAFLHIAKSRNIKKFSARLLYHHPDNLRRLAGYGTLDCPPFENVCVLHLRVHDFSTIIPYLKSRHQPFKDISFEFLEDPSPDIFREFFTALNSPTRRQSLRRIKLRSCPQSRGLNLRKAASVLRPRLHGFPVGKGDTSPVHFEVLAPLLGFSLHAFEVHLNNPIILNDDELAHLVQGWPDLETFKVTTKRESSPFPTLRGLLLLLARCQKLCHLKLRVDARTIPSLTEDELRMCNMVIKQLQIADSPISSERSSVEGVARFLLEHFPSLTGVTQIYEGYEPSGIWEKVNMQIKEIRSLDKSPGPGDMTVLKLESSSSDSDSEWH